MVRLLVSRECLWFHVLHNDGFGDAVMDAGVVLVEEILDEAEATLEGGRAIAECALDGLPTRDSLVFQRNHTDAHEALAGREAVGHTDEEAEINDKPDRGCELEGSLYIEFDIGGGVAVGGVIDLFVDLKLLLDEVLQAHLCR